MNRAVSECPGLNFIRSMKAAVFDFFGKPIAFHCPIVTIQSRLHSIRERMPKAFPSGEGGTAKP